MAITIQKTTILIILGVSFTIGESSSLRRQEGHVYVSVDIEPPPKHDDNPPLNKYQKAAFYASVNPPSPLPSTIHREPVDNNKRHRHRLYTHQHVRVETPTVRSNASAASGGGGGAHRLQRSPQVVAPQATARFDHDDFYEQLQKNQFRLTYFNPSAVGVEKPCGMLISGGTILRHQFHERFTTRFRRCKLSCYEPKWVALACSALTSAHELADNLNVLKSFVHEMNRMPFGIAGLNLSLSIESSSIYQLPTTLLDESLHKYAQYIRQVHFINCTSLTSPLPDLSPARQLDLLSIQGCPNVRALHRARLPPAHKLNLVRLRVLLHDTGIKTLTELELPPHLQALEFVCSRKCRIGRVQPELFAQFPLLDYIYIDGVADGLYAAHVLNGTAHVSVVVVRNSRLNAMMNTNYNDNNNEDAAIVNSADWSIAGTLQTNSAELYYDEVSDDNKRRHNRHGAARAGPRMRALILENAGLEALPQQAFKGVERRLQYLSLAGNQLQRIERATFQHLLGLRFLNLIDNPIRSIERDTFDQMSQLRELRLPSHGESFYDCRDCANLWLREWLKSSPHFLAPRDPSYYYCFAESNGVKEYRPIIETDEDKCEYSGGAPSSTAALVPQHTQQIKLYASSHHTVTDEDDDEASRFNKQRISPSHQNRFQDTIDYADINNKVQDDNGQRDPFVVAAAASSSRTPASADSRRDTSSSMRNSNNNVESPLRSSPTSTTRQSSPHLTAGVSTVPKSQRVSVLGGMLSGGGSDTPSRSSSAGSGNNNVYVPQPASHQPVYGGQMARGQGLRNATVIKPQRRTTTTASTTTDATTDVKQRENSAVTLSTSTKSTKSGASRCSSSMSNVALIIALLLLTLAHLPNMELFVIIHVRLRSCSLVNKICAAVRYARWLRFVVGYCLHQNHKSLQKLSNRFNGSLRTCSLDRSRNFQEAANQNVGNTKPFVVHSARSDVPSVQRLRSSAMFEL